MTAYMKSAREEILDRIRRHTAAGSPPAAPQTALDFPELSREERIAAFVREAQLVGVKCFLAADAAAARDYAEKLVTEKGGEAVAARRAAVHSLGLRHPHVHPHGGFAAEKAAVSITEADYALAESGTLVMFAETGEGRTLSLLAPVNISVVPASRILTGVSELFAREPEAASRSSAMVCITGPSRTGDIELTLSVGVHGPGEMHALVLMYA